jgi:selenoprotein W-related protein
MRSAWMAQELLTTFEEDLGEVALIPSEIAGRFTIMVEDEILFDRKREGRFPEIKELKQLVRDKVCPEKSLGHSDKNKTKVNNGSVRRTLAIADLGLLISEMYLIMPKSNIRNPQSNNSSLIKKLP